MQNSSLEWNKNQDENQRTSSHSHIPPSFHYPGCILQDSGRCYQFSQSCKKLGTVYWRILFYRYMISYFISLFLLFLSTANFALASCCSFLSMLNILQCTANLWRQYNFSVIEDHLILLWHKIFHCPYSTSILGTLFSSL